MVRFHPSRALFVSVAAAAVLAAPLALARTGANPAGRFVAPVAGAVREAAPSPLRVAAPTTAERATVVPAPLPAGAIQLDSTYYDLQDMGSLGTRIAHGTDGRVHVTWEDDLCDIATGGCPPNTHAPQPYPMRGMSYSWRSAAGIWTKVGKVMDSRVRGCCPNFELVGGFGSIALTPDGRAAIAQHINEDGCDERADFYLQDAVNGTTWTGYLTTPYEDPSYLFPQVTALPNGSFVLLGEVPLTPPGHFYEETRAFRVSRLAAAGTPFSCPGGFSTWQLGPWMQVAPPTLFSDGFGAYPSLASASDGRVGVAVTDFGKNTFLIESSNGTFQAGTITIRNLTNYTDAAVVKSDSTSGEWRPYINCHLAYRDTTPNVVWAELQARRVNGNVEVFDWRSRIRHWSSKSGLSTAYQVQAGEADRYDDIDLGLSGPIAGFNTISVDWPQVGFSADGSETYVVWLRFTDAEVDASADAGLPGIITGVGYGDIAASVRRDAGWSAPQNLSQTPLTDERYPSIAAYNPNGRAHVLFQAAATNEAGVQVVGDRGDTTLTLVRRIAYMEPKLGASLVAVGDGTPPSSPAITSYPNPARGSVTFALDPARLREGAAVLVFSASGRRVARIPAARGAITWDGSDDAGRRLPSGLYFARLEGDRRMPGTKFLWIR